VPAGAAGPNTPPSQITGTLDCVFLDGLVHEAPVYSAGLAPGMVGIYQVALPTDLRDVCGVSCGFVPISDPPVPILVAPKPGIAGTKQPPNSRSWSLSQSTSQAPWILIAKHITKNFFPEASRILWHRHYAFSAIGASKKWPFGQHGSVR
jgi:hypothetical protein